MPSPRELPDLGMEPSSPESPSLRVDSLPLRPQVSPKLTALDSKNNMWKVD